MIIDKKAASLVLIRGNKVLMQLRDEKPRISYPGYWCLPGGSLEGKESFEEAVARELEEETGYYSENPVFFMTEIYPLPDNNIVEARRFFDFYDEKQEIQCFEGQKMEWRSLDEISKSKVIGNHCDAIKVAMRLADVLRRK